MCYDVGERAWVSFEGKLWEVLRGPGKGDIGLKKILFGSFWSLDWGREAGSCCRGLGDRWR